MYLLDLPFSTFTSDAGIKAEPSLLSAVIAPKPTVLIVPLISPRTYRLLHIVNECTVRLSLGTQSRAKVVRTHHS